MSGGAKQKQGAYTIVEVLIFMAITGLLFVITANTITGKQNTALFTTGVQEFHRQIEGVMSDVRNGYYPGNITFRCRLNFAGNIVLEAGVNTQGTNDQCVFLGKVLTFVDDDNRYTLTPIAGRRLTPAGQNVKRFNESNLEPINTAEANLAAQFNITGDVRVSNIILVRSAGDYGDIEQFGFFNGIEPVASPHVAGTNTLTYAPVRTGQDITNLRNNGDADINPLAIILCLRQSADASGRKAAIIIGGNRGTLSSELHIGDFAQAVNNVSGGASCP